MRATWMVMAATLALSLAPVARANDYGKPVLQPRWGWHSQGWIETSRRAQEERAELNALERASPRDEAAIQAKRTEMAQTKARWLEYNAADLQLQRDMKARGLEWDRLSNQWVPKLHSHGLRL